MGNAMNNFRNILFVADGSKGEQAALSKMLDVVRETGARVTVMQVMLPVADAVAVGAALDFDDLQQRVNDEARERLVRLIKSCSRSARPPIVVREGIDYIEVIREVSTGGHDLVAKAASTEPGLAALLFGTLDMHLLRKCPCPVLILKPRKKIVHARVLAALDIDDHGLKGEAMHANILDHAASIAGFEEGSLDILHAWHLPYEYNMRNEEKIRKLKVVDVVIKDLRSRKQHRLETLAARWEALAPRIHLLKGLAHQVIPRFTRDHGVDLVVMGTVGRTGIQGFFMGNTAEKILLSLNCSVLAIKPKGFKSPVR
jgi:nucleotide-binding universal stress UspA family protein